MDANAILENSTLTLLLRATTKGGAVLPVCVSLGLGVQIRVVDVGFPAGGAHGLGVELHVHEVAGAGVGVGIGWAVYRITSVSMQRLVRFMEVS